MNLRRNIEKNDNIETPDLIDTAAELVLWFQSPVDKFRPFFHCLKLSVELGMYICVKEFQFYLRFVFRFGNEAQFQPVDHFLISVFAFQHPV